MTPSDVKEKEKKEKKKQKNKGERRMYKIETRKDKIKIIRTILESAVLFNSGVCDCTHAECQQCLYSV